MELNGRKLKERLFKKGIIIDAAEKLFFQKGFNNCTVADIASEAEFTKKTIYSYFTSKEEIYYEIILRGFKILNGMIEKAVSEEQSEIENIRKMGEAFVKFSTEYKGYFEFIANFKDDYEVENKNVREELTRQCHDEGEYSLDVLKECIKSGMSKGEIITQYDPIDISITLWSSILGFSSIINQKKTYIEKIHNKTPDEILETGFTLILNSIRR